LLWRQSFVYEGVEEIADERNPVDYEERNETKQEESAVVTQQNTSTCGGQNI
jgi:hypothetical protein